MCPRVLVMLVALVSTAISAAGKAQQLALGEPRPHFIRAGLPAKGREVVEVKNAAVLHRSIGIQLEDATIEDALAELGRHTGVRIAYNADRLPKLKRISLSAGHIQVVAVLTQILFDSGLDVAVARNGQMAVVECRHLIPARSAEVLDSGAVVGRVTDKATGSPISGATVALSRTRFSATTTTDGSYSIRNVPPGTYTVMGRYIGYAPLTATITIGGGEEVAVDLALVRSVQKLDEVVTTGTFLPTEVRAIPTPVTVIDARDVEAQRPQTVQELLRQAVPTAVGWDNAAVPNQTVFSARGATSLSPGSGQMKVLIDGVESAYPTITPVDPTSIERVEVVRGPQAATLYGSDAVGGVVQIFTKRGGVAGGRPRLEAQAALGLQETPYAGHAEVLRQEYRAAIRGGAPDVSYNVGASYSRIGEYLPNDEISAQSNPSIYGGIRYGDSLITVDVSGRHFVSNVPGVLNPQLWQTGFIAFSRPNFQPTRFQNQMIGGRLTLTPARWWRHTLVLGIDRYAQDNVQAQARRTTAADTLLTILSASRTKNSVAYTSSVTGTVGRGLSGSVTVGADHYSLPYSQWFTNGALNTTGSVLIAGGRTVSPSLSTTTNTGYFAQGQLGVRDALYLTAGLRVDDHSDFGDSLRLPVSPRFGVSYVMSMRSLTVKARASYGRAIRAPSPGQKDAFPGAGLMVLANPALGPERQRGWDAGIDLMIGSTASLGVTYYDQTADNLIQQVLVSPTPVATYQNQNVGLVDNAGLEVEASLLLRGADLRAQYGYARARVARLSSTYTGDLRLGDQALGTPRHTAGVSAILTPLPGTSVSLGMSHLGSWRYYDLVAQFSCFGGTGPCQPSTRDYIIEYPSLTKIAITVTQQLSPAVQGYVTVDNVTNDEGFELVNSTPVFGRATTVGARVTY